MNALVIPSNRPEQLAEFFQAWKSLGGWDRVYIMEDAEYRSAAMLKAAVESDVVAGVYCHKDVAEDLDDKAWIISKGDSACRSYGFYRAWQDGAEYILTLDDDVRPVNRGLMYDHIALMKQASRFRTSVQGLWPRGMPNVDPYRTDVKASMGLWSGVPDLYADDMVDHLNVSGKIPTDYKPPLGSRIVADGEFIPICGMNFCIHRDAVPLCWFPLMGQGQPYSRFDDIWMGLVLKRGLDILGWKLSVGEPHVRHIRASDPVKCAERERPGRAVNDKLWLAMAKPSYIGGFDNPVDVMSAIGNDVDHFIGGDPYFIRMVEGMRTWASLYRN